MSAQALLTIAIATVGKNLHKIRWANAHENIRYLLVVQAMEKEYTKDLPNREDIDVVFTKTKGLSHSRNVALTHCKTPYMLVADDDLIHDISAIISVVTEMQEHDKKVVIASTTHQDHLLRWEGNGNTHLQQSDLGKVASYEIFLHVPTVVFQDVGFHTDFGVGSGCYPAGEENLFLFFLFQSGVTIYHSKEIVAHHPDISSGYRDLGVIGVLGSLRVQNTLRPVFPSWRRNIFQALFSKNKSFSERLEILTGDTKKVAFSSLKTWTETTQI